MIYFKIGVVVFLVLAALEMYSMVKECIKDRTIYWNLLKEHVYIWVFMLFICIVAWPAPLAILYLTRKK